MVQINFRTTTSYAYQWCRNHASMLESSLSSWLISHTQPCGVVLAKYAIMPGKQGGSLLQYTMRLPLCSYWAIYTIAQRRGRQMESSKWLIGYSNILKWKSEHSEHLLLDDQWLIVALKGSQKVSCAKFNFFVKWNWILCSGWRVIAYVLHTSQQIQSQTQINITTRNYWMLHKEKLYGLIFILIEDRIIGTVLSY